MQRLYIIVGLIVVVIIVIIFLIILAKRNKNPYEKTWNYKNTNSVIRIDVNTGDDIKDKENGDYIRNRTRDPNADAIKVSYEFVDKNIKGKGTMGIHGAGSRDNTLPSYTLKLEKKAALIPGFSELDKWILYSPLWDLSCIRNILPFILSNEMGQYASPFQFCELWIDGFYKGILILIVKDIEVDNGIFAVTDHPKDSDKDISGTVTPTPPYYSSAAGNFNPPSCRNGSVKPCDSLYFVVKSKDVEKDRVIINDKLEKILSVLYNPKTVQEAHKYFDLNSTMVFFILNELSNNIDAFKFNSYFTVMRTEDKIYTGPLWDNDLGFGGCARGAASGCARTDFWRTKFILYDTYGLASDGYYNNICHRSIDPSSKRIGPCGLAPWFGKLPANDVYRNTLRNFWLKYRKTVLSIDNIYKIIDYVTAILKRKLPVSGYPDSPIDRYMQLVHTEKYKPNGNLRKDDYMSWTYDQHVEEVKVYCKNRLNWMDQQPLLNASIEQKCYAFIETDGNINMVSHDTCNNSVKNKTGYCICDKGYYFLKGNSDRNKTCDELCTRELSNNVCSGTGTDVNVYNKPFIVNTDNDNKNPIVSSIMRKVCKQ